MDETAELVRRAGDGDREALGELLERDRGRLHRMIRLRLDPRLRRRVDVSDVVQEIHLEAARRLADYRDGPEMPFYLWLRLLSGQKLADLYRHHLGARKRDLRREQAAFVQATSIALAEQLAGSMTTPSRAAHRAEMEARVRETLEALDPVDREVLALRHFEHLSNGETAQALGIESAAASKRYVRALKRLGEALGPEALR